MSAVLPRANVQTTRPCVNKVGFPDAIPSVVQTKTGEVQTRNGHYASSTTVIDPGARR